MNWQICHPTVLYGLFNAMSYILRYSLFFGCLRLIWSSMPFYKRHTDVENTLYST